MQDIQTALLSSLLHVQSMSVSNQFRRLLKLGISDRRHYVFELVLKHVSANCDVHEILIVRQQKDWLITVLTLCHGQLTILELVVDQFATVLVIRFEVLDKHLGIKDTVLDKTFHFGRDSLFVLTQSCLLEIYLEVSLPWVPIRVIAAQHSVTLDLNCAAMLQWND